MATDILEIVSIADTTPDDDDDDDDDELTVVYSTPVSSTKASGNSKSNAIPVDNYPLTTKTFIDLSQDSSFTTNDDELQLLDSFPRRVFKGECSSSKSAKGTDITVPSTFMCEICADERPTKDLFSILGCDHAYCSECMSSYVASKLQDNITTINCPASGCNGFLEPYHCRPILPKQVFDRWGDALCEAVILESEKFYCPFKDCSALLIDEKGLGGEVIVQSDCPDCNRLFCAQCKVPWHTGIECEEFQKLKKDERSNEDIMLMNLAKSKNWSRCSRCGFYVEKSDGCLFMQCRCGYTFCYHCGAHLDKHLHYCTKCKR